VSFALKKNVRLLPSRLTSTLERRVGDVSVSGFRASNTVDARFSHGNSIRTVA